MADSSAPAHVRELTMDPLAGAPATSLAVWGCSRSKRHFGGMLSGGLKSGQSCTLQLDR